MDRMKKIGHIRPKSAAEVKYSRLGIGFEKLDRGVFDPEKAYDKVARLGVKKVRLQSGWMRTEKEKGVYDFAWLDSIVDNLISRGLEPWMCLCYGNPLYTEIAKPIFGAVGCPPVGSEEEKAAWLAYVRATVAHFKGRISLYEIWNEPDLSYSWRREGQSTPNARKNAEEYGIFARDTAIAIRETDKNAKICGFAAAYSDYPYFETALSTGLGEQLDYCSFHKYAKSEIGREEETKALHSWLKAKYPDIGLIQGETGVQSEPNGHGALHSLVWSERKQTTLLLRNLLCDLHTDLSFTSYFSAMDMIEALNGLLSDKASYLDYGYFGVIKASFDENGVATGEYTEKPSFAALQTLASLFAGNAHAETLPIRQVSRPSPRFGKDAYDCDDASVTMLSYRLDNGDSALAYWNSVPVLTSTYENTISFDTIGDYANDVHFVDLRTGDVYEIPGSIAFKNENGGKSFLNLPIYEFPSLILFGNKTEIIKE